MDAFSPWPSAPADLVITPGQVDLFCFRLDLNAGRLNRLGGPALSATLSPEEQARAGRYLRATEQRHFIAAHGQVREILATLTGLPPASLRFVESPQGKPALEGAIGEGALSFNLSHSAELALLAVTAGRTLGVDLEWTAREVDYTNIAGRFFAPTEVSELLSLPPEARRQGFFNGWTRKEAYIKARGLGLAIPLDSFSVSLAPGSPPALSAAGWSLYALDPAPGYTGALVVEGPTVNLRCWRWE